MIYIQLLESMALIAISAYIYNQSHVLKNMIKGELKFIDKIALIVFFSLLGIIGNYTGVNVEPYAMDNIRPMGSIQAGYIGLHDAIANTRPIAAIVAGYIGGPVFGVIVGIIAGTHRYFLGGFTALSCGVATLAEGLVGGLIKKLSKDEGFNLKKVFIGAVAAECCQMIIILILSRPFSSALKLVEIIAVPMILINSLGSVIFINIIKSAKEEYDRIGAIEAQRALNITKKTVNYMRKGLNEKTAKNVSEIIYEMTNADGIFIGDKNGFLAYSGISIHEEKLRQEIQKYNKSPDYKIIELQYDGKSMFFVCAPFKIPNSGFEGVLGLGVRLKKNINPYFIQFGKELSDLLSNQIELYKLNKLAKEASTAEFRALRAQIEPHFLFNALNTIASFCRTNPSKARELIIDLSNYFRQTLKRQEDFVYLKDEIEFIQSYLSIETARFGNRLQLIIDIPDEMMDEKVPVFVLQPIVENAIKHGILPKPEGGKVYLEAFFENDEIRFCITDTGVGMNEERLNEVLTKWPGIGLKNVNERLKLLYGEDHGLDIKTSVNNGTKISFLISMREVSSING
ncbi:LytS/YhcK type 5TM receptor domain-containing protein [Clostridium sp. MT-14]|uniref:Histidine kinase n=1 Tax=Clostridium aromativorans TaxID=2836848 RepID=A0ABS8N6J8_9CLOT|nr:MULTISPECIES: LytS/YhcK type 5TM receptor domain-containing protein [Clostridium]KAA8665239.1 histidine kinase [Clostridium sp. HV4-5-A1G]MCC9294794.1 histidine kinase [Clostridium aromativorans]CAB1262259.1 Histidine kinase [Clostridiaceae bacterium BL-3]